MPNSSLNWDLNGGQGSLFCRCNAVLGCSARACGRCRQKAVNSRWGFGGWRDALLTRDHGLCTVCGQCPRQPHVRHRRPGVQRCWLVTICPHWPARIHMLAATSRRAWIEQYPGAPGQIPLFREGA